MTWKALIGEENGDWELRTAKPNKDDDSYAVGDRDYIADAQTQVRTLRIKSFMGYKRYKFFIAFRENPVPLDLSNRGEVSGVDTATALRAFRRAHIVQALGRAARELPGNSEQRMKLLLYGGIGIVALVLYYTGAINQILAWFTGG